MLVDDFLPTYDVSDAVAAVCMPISPQHGTRSNGLIDVTREMAEARAGVSDS